MLIEKGFCPVPMKQNSFKHAAEQRQPQLNVLHQIVTFCIFFLLRALGL